MSWLFLRGNYRFKKTNRQERKLYLAPPLLAWDLGVAGCPDWKIIQRVQMSQNFKCEKSMGAKKSSDPPWSHLDPKKHHIPGPSTPHPLFHVALSRKEPVSQGISYKPSRMPAISATNRRQKTSPQRAPQQKGRKLFIGRKLQLDLKVSPFLIGKPSISMGHLYHGYVKQPEGNSGMMASRFFVSYVLEFLCFCTTEG